MSLISESRPKRSRRTGALMVVGATAFVGYLVLAGSRPAQVVCVSIGIVAFGLAFVSTGRLLAFRKP